MIIIMQSTIDTEPALNGAVNNPLLVVAPINVNELIYCTVLAFGPVSIQYQFYSPPLQNTNIPLLQGLTDVFHQ